MYTYYNNYYYRGTHVVAKVPEMIGSRQTSWTRPHNDDLFAPPIGTRGGRKGERSWHIVEKACVDITFPRKELEYFWHLTVAPHAEYTSQTQALKATFWSQKCLKNFVRIS